MQQIFDEHLYTTELENSLKVMRNLKLNVDICCKMITTVEFFTKVKQYWPNFCASFHRNCKTNAADICRCKSILQAIAEQKSLPIPYILTKRVNGTIPADGCHRMYICEQLFGPDTKFPVLVITPTKEDTV